ncbi:MAG TPA: hypothetical protein VEU52_02705 [Candidatus Limnocylindrales bacterium]|nr:hypothetical protein [Candidatus Limnocylindrales bacterium]
MLRKAIWALALVASLALPATVKAQGDYLDVYRVKVKPEKLGEFYALTAKWVDANRQNGGDRWIAAVTIYGEGDVFQFTSTRSSYAEVDKTTDAVMAAAAKAFGADMMKIMFDFESCVANSRTEFRRRRADLSRNVPATPAAYTKSVGSSRYLRTTAVHVRPGKIAEFEGLLKDLKAAYEKNPNAPAVFVSQVIEGTKGTVYYVSTLRSSLAGFDNNPSMRELLGEDGFKKFQQVNADAVEEADSTMYRFAPEISNPPDEVAAAAPDFWHPKPAKP